MPQQQRTSAQQSQTLFGRLSSAFLGAITPTFHNASTITQYEEPTGGKHQQPQPTSSVEPQTSSFSQAARPAESELKKLENITTAFLQNASNQKAQPASTTVEKTQTLPLSHENAPGDTKDTPHKPQTDQETASNMKRQRDMTDGGMDASLQSEQSDSKKLKLFLELPGSGLTDRDSRSRRPPNRRRSFAGGGGGTGMTSRASGRQQFSVSLYGSPLSVNTAGNTSMLGTNFKSSMFYPGRTRFGGANSLSPGLHQQTSSSRQQAGSTSLISPSSHRQSVNSVSLPVSPLRTADLSSGSAQKSLLPPAATTNRRIFPGEANKSASQQTATSRRLLRALRNLGGDMPTVSELDTNRKSQAKTHPGFWSDFSPLTYQPARGSSWLSRHPQQHPSDPVRARLRSSLGQPYPKIQLPSQQHQNLDNLPPPPPPPNTAAYRGGGAGRTAVTFVPGSGAQTQGRTSEMDVDEWGRLAGGGKLIGSNTATLAAAAAAEQYDQLNSESTNHHQSLVTKRPPNYDLPVSLPALPAALAPDNLANALPVDFAKPISDPASRLLLFEAPLTVNDDDFDDKTAGNKELDSEGADREVDLALPNGVATITGAADSIGVPVRTSVVSDSSVTPLAPPSGVSQYDGSPAPVAPVPTHICSTQSSVVTTVTSSRPILLSGPSADQSRESSAAVPAISSLRSTTKASSPDKWTCTSCLVPNEGSADKCICCTAAKPSSSTSSAATSTAPLSSSKTLSTKWTCSTCLVPNESSQDKCICCGTANPSTLADSTNISNKPLSASTKVSSDKWTCSTCLVPNESSADKCVCCGSANNNNSSKSSNQSSVGVTSFKFGQALANTTSSTSGFKFGAPLGLAVGSNSTLTTSSSAPLTSAAAPPVEQGFRFGVPLDSASSSTTSTTSTSSKTLTITTTPMPFRFGGLAPATTVSESEVSASSLNSSVTSTGSSAGVAAAPPLTPIADQLEKAKQASRKQMQSQMSADQPPTNIVPPFLKPNLATTSTSIVSFGTPMTAAATTSVGASMGAGTGDAVRDGEYWRCDECLVKNSLLSRICSVCKLDRPSDSKNESDAAGSTTPTKASASSADLTPSPAVSSIKPTGQIPATATSQPAAFGGGAALGTTRLVTSSSVKPSSEPADSAAGKPASSGGFSFGAMKFAQRSSAAPMGSSITPTTSSTLFGVAGQPLASSTSSSSLSVAAKAGSLPSFGLSASKPLGSAPGTAAPVPTAFITSSSLEPALSPMTSLAADSMTSSSVTSAGGGGGGGFSFSKPSSSLPAAAHKPFVFGGSGGGGGLGSAPAAGVGSQSAAGPSAGGFSFKPTASAPQLSRGGGFSFVPPQTAAAAAAADRPPPNVNAFNVGASAASTLPAENKAAIPAPTTTTTSGTAAGFSFAMPAGGFNFGGSAAPPVFGSGSSSAAAPSASHSMTATPTGYSRPIKKAARKFPRPQ